MVGQNPWEIDWDWDEPAPEGQQAPEDGPWTMNWDWNRAEASAATKAPLRHDLESDQWKRPEGELFHAQGFIEGVQPDQSEILATEDPSWFDAVGGGLGRFGQDVGQTFAAAVGDDPRNMHLIPATKLDAELNTSRDSWELTAKKMTALAARAVPAMTAFIAGAGLSAPTVASVATGTGTGSVAAMLQSFGPHYANGLNKYPDDPDRAYEEALKATAADGAFSALGGAASMIPIFRASPVKNFLLQTFGVQPWIGMQNMAAVENITGDRSQMGDIDRYLSVAGPGTIQAAAGAVMTPPLARSPHQRQPGEVHFADLIPEASRAEERVADANLIGGKNQRWYGDEDEASRQEIVNQPGGPGLRKRSLTPEERRSYDRIIREADEALARIAPHATAEPLKKLFHHLGDGEMGQSGGLALGKMIAYAVDTMTNPDPVGTVRHEGFHVVEALRKSGSFKPHEWQALEDAVPKWAEKHVDFLRSYMDPNLSPGDQRRRLISETIAQEFGRGRAERWKGYPPLVRRAFYRIEGLVKQLSMSAKRMFGKGITGEDVLTLIDTGVIGRRAKRIDAALRPAEREVSDFMATETVRDAVGGRSNEIAAQRAYHGTQRPFETFLEGGTDGDYMLDRALGTHFARDPEIANAFVMDRVNGEDVGAREGGRIYRGHIPDDSELLRVPQPRYESGAVASDQRAIEIATMREAYRADPNMLARYLQEARAVPADQAQQMAHRMVGDDAELDSFLNNYGGKPYNDADRQRAVRLARQSWQRQGYKGIVYENTSPEETRRASDRTSYIVFDPQRDVHFSPVERATRQAILRSGNEVVRSSRNPKQGLTAFGKALAKHATGARETSTFPKVKGSNDALNRQGAEIADQIIRDATSSETLPRGGTRIRDAIGRGLEYDANNKFVGFLDPETSSDLTLKHQIIKGRIDPRYRSQLDEELLKTKLTKGTGSQWRAELTKGGKGAKLEELEDSGLHDFLTEHADKPLTVAQVREVREANRHQLEVIELTDGTGTPIDSPEPVFVPEPNMPERYAPEPQEPDGPPNPLLGLEHDGETITPELAQALIDDFVDGDLDNLISEEVNSRINETDDYDTNEWPRYRYEVREDNRPVYEVEEIDGHGDNVDYHERLDDENEAEREARYHNRHSGRFFTIKQVPVQKAQELPLLSRLLGETAKSEDINRYEVWRSSEDTTDDGFNGAIEDGAEEPVKVFDSWREAEKYALDETRRYRVNEGERYDEYRLYDLKEDDWDADGDVFESERSAERAAERANDRWYDEWYEHVSDEADTDVRADKEWISEQIVDHLYGEVEGLTRGDQRSALRRWVDHVRGTPSRHRPETPEYREWSRRNRDRELQFNTDHARWAQRNKRRDDTHYRTYANDGGTNYRELILTAPTVKERGKGHSGHSQHSDKMMAHARTQDFDTSDGLKAKSIEELQSDEHQTASDKYWGKAGKARLAADLEAARQENAVTAVALTKALDEWVAIKAKANLSAADDTALRYMSARQMIEERLTGERGEYYKSKYPELFTPEAQEALQRWREASDRDEAAYRKASDLEAVRVSTFPHRKSWPMVLFKKVLLDAVLGGYDVITLATGQQNTDRYSYALRQAVKTVNWGERADGLFDVEFKLHDKTRDGKDTHLLTGVTLDRLAEYIGKDGAKQIMQDKLGERPNPNKGPMSGPDEKADYVSAGGYEGQNIEFGGVGMYNFYDKVMPTEIDKFFKKWGIKRERVKLKQQRPVEYYKVMRSVDGGEPQPYAEYHLATDATKMAALLNADAERIHGGSVKFIIVPPEAQYHEVHGWRITNDLRKAINEGAVENTPDGVIRLKDEYPIFRYQLISKGKTAPADPRVNTPEFRAWWKKSKVHDALLHPKRVYHGTPDATFDAFKPGSPEGFFGARFYFTSSPGDAYHNYADPKTAPDLRIRVENEADRIIDDRHPEGFADWRERQRAVDAMVEETLAKLPTPGAVMPVYLSIQKPVYWDGPNRTVFTGRELSRFAAASTRVMERLAPNATRRDQQVFEKIAEGLRWEYEGGISVKDLAHKIVRNDNVYDASDDQGRLLYNEVIRAALEEMGYDGIILPEADRQFSNMDMDADTTHYVAFRPNQIKSVFNDGSWSSRAEFMRQIVQGPWKGKPPTYDTATEDTLASALSIDALMQGWRSASRRDWEMDPDGTIAIDDDVYLSERPEDLKKVYRDDWLTLRSGAPGFKQWALMSSKGPVGRVHGTIKGDAIEVGWLGVVGGEEGLSESAFMLLGSAIRGAVPPGVTRITGLRKSQVGAYEKPQPKASPRKTQTQVPARPKSNVRTARPETPGFQRFGPQRVQPDVEDDPLLEYYQGM